MSDITARHQRLLDDLATGGKLTPPWLDSFAALPRHQFIPDTIWDDSSGELVPLRRADDPGRWWDVAYAP
jgi:protein-L-isoaspartate O-methyltransferase